MAAAARIGIVAIEVAHHHAVGESRELGQGAMRGADDGCAFRIAYALRELAGNRGGFGVIRGERDTQRVEHAPLAVVQYRGRHVRIFECVRVIGDAVDVVVHYSMSLMVIRL